MNELVRLDSTAVCLKSIVATVCPRAVTSVIFYDTTTLIVPLKLR